MQTERILIIGAGNLATSLAVALKNAGENIIGVWSRTPEAARELGEKIDTFYSCRMEDFSRPDIVIIAVADAAFGEVARRAASLFPDALALHTAGSIAMDALREAGFLRYGVLYPMQTFSKARVVNFSSVSTFVEGCDADVLDRVRALASRPGGKVYDATSEQRRYLHLSAVFACNFTNAMYAMSAQLLQRHGLPFEAMLPLIDETALKVHTLHPRDAQTGPARRGDEAVMQHQCAMLDDELLNIYNVISDYIAKNR